VYYTQSILLGESPFTQKKEKEKEKEEAKNILKGLIEEVRALYKKVAPTKETYAERLKKDLPFYPLLYPPYYYYLLPLLLLIGVLLLLEARKSSYKKES